MPTKSVFPSKPTGRRGAKEKTENHHLHQRQLEKKKSRPKKKRRVFREKEKQRSGIYASKSCGVAVNASLLAMAPVAFMTSRAKSQYIKAMLLRPLLFVGITTST